MADEKYIDPSIFPGEPPATVRVGDDCYKKIGPSELSPDTDSIQGKPQSCEAPICEDQPPVYYDCCRSWGCCFSSSAVLDIEWSGWGGDRTSCNCPRSGAIYGMRRRPSSGRNAGCSWYEACLSLPECGHMNTSPGGRISKSFGFAEVWHWAELVAGKIVGGWSFQIGGMVSEQWPYLECTPGWQFGASETGWYISGFSMVPGDCCGVPWHQGWNTNVRNAGLCYPLADGHFSVRVRNNGCCLDTDEKCRKAQAWNCNDYDGCGETEEGI